MVPGVVATPSSDVPGRADGRDPVGVKNASEGRPRGRSAETISTRFSRLGSRSTRSLERGAAEPNARHSPDCDDGGPGHQRGVAVACYALA